MDSAKQNSRDIILNTAARLFAIQGYYGTGLNQIIKESGAPKGSLYYYFPNGKEELALECIRLIQRLLNNKLTDTLSNTLGPIESIQNFIRNIATDARNTGYDGYIPIGFWAAVEISSVSDTLRTACKNTFEELKEKFASKIVQGGFTKSKADDLATLIISMIEGAVILMITQQDNRSLLLVLEHIPLLLKE